MNKIFCFLFGHKWNLLRVGLGKTRFEETKCFKIATNRMYWHWYCENCGLYNCNRRFKRYVK